VGRLSMSSSTDSRRGKSPCASTHSSNPRREEREREREREKEREREREREREKERERKREREREREAEIHRAYHGANSENSIRKLYKNPEFSLVAVAFF
jgi:hypothetical protein